MEVVEVLLNKYTYIYIHINRSVGRVGGVFVVGNEKRTQKRKPKTNSQAIEMPMMMGRAAFAPKMLLCDGAKIN